MKLSNKFTLARAIFAPIFFLIFNIPTWLNSDVLSKISAFIMIPLLAVFELTDYWDGHYARKNGEVSDFGKIFDPFADVILNLNDSRTAECAETSLSWILGANPLGISYVSGIGENSVKTIHSEIYANDGINSIPDGYMPQGPNYTALKTCSRFAAKC